MRLFPTGQAAARFAPALKFAAACGLALALAGCNATTNSFNAISDRAAARRTAAASGSYDADGAHWRDDRDRPGPSCAHSAPDSRLWPERRRLVAAQRRRSRGRRDRRGRHHRSRQGRSRLGRRCPRRRAGGGRRRRRTHSRTALRRQRSRGRPRRPRRQSSAHRLFDRRFGRVARRLPALVPRRELRRPHRRFRGPEGQEVDRRSRA